MLPALAVGETYEAVFHWDTFGQAGSHVLTAVADPDAILSEVDEDDNTAQVAVEVRPPASGVDLAVQASGFAFDPALPAELPVSVAIDVEVRNLGLTAADQARVVVWHGEPGTGAIVFDQRLDLAARSLASITLDYPLAAPAAAFTAVLDPDAEIAEDDEANNLAAATLATEPTVDLEVTPADITLLTPPVLETDVELRVTVRNRGTRDLPHNAGIRFTITDGDVVQVLFDSEIFLTAGESRTLPVIWPADLDGVLTFRAELDGTGIPELDAANNAAELQFEIGSFTEPNLRVRSADVSFDPDPGLEGAPLAISVLVSNTGGVTAQDAAVVAFDGHPDDGGAVIAGPVPVTLAAAESQSVQLTWDRVPDDADRDVFVVVDPDDLIAEVHEDDNLTFRAIEILSLPDFALSEAAITLQPSFPRPGDAVSVTVEVSNLGEQGTGDVSVRIYDADPLAGGELLAPETSVAVGASGTATAAFDFTLDGAGGTQAVFAVVNGDGVTPEQTSANNTAVRQFAVQDGDFAVTSRYFSPDGDGVLDSVRFVFRLEVPADVVARVVDDRDREVRLLGAFAGVTEGEVDWDGREDGGRLADDGRYFIQAVDGGTVLGGETALGEALVVLDTNRTSLLRAVETQYESFVNLTCALPDVEDARFAANGLWIYFVDRATSSLRDRLQRVSTRTFAVEDVYVEEEAETFEILEFMVSDDASRVAFEADGQRIFVARGDGTELQEFTHTASLIQLVTFDADASHLHYLEGSSTLVRRPVAALQQREVVFDGVSNRWFLSPDRRTIVDRDSSAISSVRTTIIDLGTGASTELDPIFGFVAGWSNDSSRFAASDFGLIKIYDRAGALQSTLTGATDFAPPPELAALDPLDADGVASLEFDAIAWSRDDSQLAVRVRHVLVLPGDGGSIEYAHIVVFDVASGEASSLGWTGAAGAQSAPGTLPLSSSAVPTWADDDDALRFLPDWAVFLGEQPSEEFQFDPDNRWLPLLRSFPDGGELEISGRLGQLLSARDKDDPESLCFRAEDGDDLFLWRSLMNLTADLRIRRSVDPTAVLLEGSAVDLHFESYLLEYRAAGDSGPWSPVSPPRSVPAFDELFQTWVPPGPGTWQVRLTVEDLAGNLEQAVKQVSTAEFPQITDVYVLPELFSPNFDGTLDQTFVHYQALEPVVVEVEIFDSEGLLVNRLVRETPIPGEDALPWDGRGSDGQVVPDGHYTLRVQGSYEYEIEVDTTPVPVALELLDPYRLEITPADPEPVFDEFLFPTLRHEIVAASADIAEASVERGEGENPAEWLAFPRWRPFCGMSPCETNLSFHEFTGGSFRLRVADHAGNVSVASSGVGSEKLMLAGIGAPVLTPDGSGFEDIVPFRRCEAGSDSCALRGLILADHTGTVYDGFSTVTGEVRFLLAETLRADIRRLTIEHRPRPTDSVPDPPWAESEIESFLVPGSIEPVGVPPQGAFEVLWDELVPVVEFEREVRLVAEDLLGTRRATATFVLTRTPESESETCESLVFEGFLRLDDPVFERDPEDGCVDGAQLRADVEAMLAATGIDPLAEDVFWGYETFEGDLENLTLLLRSNLDPSYGLWVSVPLVARGGGAFLFLPDPQLQFCTRYRYQLSGDTPPTFDPETGSLVSQTLRRESGFEFGCLHLGVIAEAELPQTCGEAAPERVTITLVASDGTGTTPPRDLVLARRLADGAEELLLHVPAPVSGLEYRVDLDMSLYEEGVEVFEARVSNVGGYLETELVPLNVDRVPPVVDITVPEEGAVVCGLDNRFEIEGTFSDQMPDTAAGPFEGVPRIYEDKAFRLPGLNLDGRACEDSFILDCFTPETTIGATTWEGSGVIAEIHDFEGPVTHLLRFWDRGGNLACVERSYVVDADVRLQVLVDTTVFSPNGDGVLDQVRLDFQAGEAQEVDIEMVPAVFDPNQGWIAAGPRVRVLTDDLPVLGQGHLVWDGRDDGGAVVADGRYLFLGHTRDDCGNQREFQTGPVRVDTVPPQVEILYPRLEDQNLPVLVEIQYVTLGESFSDLSFGETHDPTSWQLLRAGRDSEPNFFDWNTLGLEGDWALRLRASDRAGNSAEVIEPLTLPVRPNLITDLEPTPELFSPNGDGRRDTVSLRFGLLEEADAELRIESLEGILIRTLADERFPAGSSTRAWNGLDELGLPAPDARYRLVLTATLASDPNFIQQEAVTFELDATPPTVMVTRPENGFVDGGGSVLGTVNDEHLTGYTVFLAQDGGGPPEWLELGSGETSVFTGVLAPLGDPAEGPYQLRILAEDEGESQTEVVEPFVVDTIPPEVAIETPAPAAVIGAVGGPAAVAGSAADEHLESWRLEFGAGEQPEVFTTLASGSEPAEPGSVLASWDLSALADGPYVLRLTAIDQAGNSARVDRPVVVDNTPPVAILTSPADGGFVTEATDVTGTATDLHFVEYRLEIAASGSGEWLGLRLGTDEVEDGLLHDWQALPPEGPYDLRLTATDLAANVGQTTIQLTVDATAPPAPIQLEAEVEGLNDARLTWTPSSAPDLAGYRVYRGGQPLTAELVQPTTYLDASLAEGSYVYRVTAIDQAGNESEPSNDAEVEIDLDPPQARILLPEDGARVGGVVDVEGNATSQDFSEYRLYAERADGTGGRQLVRRSPVPVVGDLLGQWSSLGAPEESAWRFSLEAEDLSGNVATDEVVVVVDNQAPPAPIQLTATLDGLRDVDVAWTAVDAPDLLGYVLYRNGRLANASGPTVGDLRPFVLTATTYRDVEVPDGTYTYVVYALDLAGNLSPPSNPDGVTIETRPPQALIVDPEDGRRFEHALPILAETVDNDVAEVRFQYLPAGAADWVDLGATDEAPPWTAVLDPEALGLEYGELDLRAVATDTSDLTDPAPVAITVEYADLTPPAPVVPVTTLVTGGDVTVSWQASPASDLAGYHVYRRVGPVAWSRRTVDPITETELLEPGLEDALYVYTVSAVDQAGNESPIPDFAGGVEAGDQAEARVFTPVLEQPYTPTPFQAGDLHGFGAAGYQATIEISNTAGVVALPPVPVTDAATPYPGLDGVFSASALAFEQGINALGVVMTDGDGNTSKSASVSVLADLAPAAPQDLDGTADGFDVDLTWSPNPEADLLGYRLFRGGEPAAADEVGDFDHFDSSHDTNEPPEAAFDGDPATSWRPRATQRTWLEAGWPGDRVVTGVEIDWLPDPDTIYFAEDFRLQGRFDGVWVTLARIEDNTEVSNRVVFDLPYRTDRLRLFVESSYSATDYRIRVAEMRVHTAVLLPLSPTATTDTAPDGVHVYTLAALDELGLESPPSAPTEPFEIGDVDPPPAPVLSARVINETDAELTWTEVADAARYDLYRDGVELAQHTDLANRLYLDADLPNGFYRYVVRAVDAAGNASEPSNEVAVTIDVPDDEPAKRPALHSPTVPGRVLETDATSTTLIGLAEPGAGVTLRRDGQDIGVVPAAALSVVERSGQFFDVLTAGGVGRAVASPDGRYVWVDDLAGSTALVDLDDGDVQTYGFGLGRWSADGTLIYTNPYVLPGPVAEIRRVDPADGGTELVATADLAFLSVPSPSGDLYAVIANRGPENGIWTLDPETGEWNLVVANVVNEIDPFAPVLAWSADGGRIAWVQQWVGGRFQLRSYHFDTGQVHEVATGLDEPFLDWSPTGDRLLYHSFPDTARIYDFSDDSVQEIAGVRGSRVRFVADGGTVAYVVDGTDLALFDLEIAREDVVFTAPSLSRKLEWTSNGSFIAADGGEILRLTPAGRFTLAGVALTAGDNTFTAITGDDESAPIVISSTGDEALPDYAIELAVVPGLLPAGDQLRATAVVESAGQAAAPAAGLSMAIVGPDGFSLDLVEGEPVGPLAVGASHAVSRELTFDVAPGTYTVVAAVDPLGDVVEENEANNLATAALVVFEPGSGPVLGVATDRTLYQAQQDLQATVEILGTSADFDGALEISITDQAGFAVHTFAPRPVTDLGFGQTLTEIASWNTGQTLGGDYLVAARLRDLDGALAAEASAPFEILGQADIGVEVSTDSPSYPPGSAVALFGSFDYQSGNVVITGSEAVLTVFDPAGGVVTSWTQAVGTLLPGAQGTMARTWPSGTAAVGTYRAVFELRAAGQTEASGETFFQLAHTALLAELSALKTATLAADNDGDGSVSPGDRVRYQILLVNAGQGAAAGVTVTDPVPQHTTLVPASVTTDRGSVTSTDPVAVAIDVLPAGTSASITFEVDLDPAFPPGVIDISNQATINADGVVGLLSDDPATPQPADPTVTLIVSAPRLLASKTDLLADDRDGDGLPGAGDLLRYEITLANAGNAAATALRFEDAAPAYTSLVAGTVSAAPGNVTEGNAADDTAVEVTVDELAPGETASLAFEVEIEQPLPDGVLQISSQGLLASAELPVVLTDDPDQAGDSDPTLTALAVEPVAEPVLTAEKVDLLVHDPLLDGGASPGDVLEYVITLVNSGGSATGVILVDPIPESTALVPGSAETTHGTAEIVIIPGDDELPDIEALEVLVGELGGGDAATVSFRVAIDNPLAGENEIVNQALVDSAELEEVLTDDPELPGEDDPTVTPVLGCNYGLTVAFAEGCRAVFVPDGCGSCDGKVSELTLEYLGAVEDAFIEVVQDSDGLVIFAATVQPGERLTLLGADDQGTLSSKITLSVDEVENAEIHTSCSRPIGPGLERGDFRVISGRSRRGGVLCPVLGGDACGSCDGTVAALTLAYLGADEAFVEVSQGDDGALLFAESVAPGEELSVFGADDSGTLSFEVVVHVDGIEHARLDTSCGAQIGPGLEIGDFTVVDGSSSDGGPLCPLPACGACDGGATELTLEYQGPEPDAYVEVFRIDDSDADSDSDSDSGSDSDGDPSGDPVVVFAGVLQPGDRFGVSGPEGETTLGAEIAIHVGGVENGRIPADCSGAVGPGLVAGDFLVVEGASLDGGALCPFAACTVLGAGRLVVDGGEVRWQLGNAGATPVVIDGLTVLWPPENGDLEKIRVESEEIFDQHLPPPTALVDSGWKGEVGDREIPAGSTRELRLRFEHDAVAGNFVCTAGADEDDDSDCGDSDSGDSDSGDSDSDSDSGGDS
ncbi:MAG: DUF11 domain-containing protein [bacterium]|nr:DUF11 domain-containing protein [bacterium]